MSIKYRFIGYNDDDVIRPLCIKLPQMIWYVKSIRSNMTMSFKISDKQFLKKYNQIYKKVKNLLNIKFDSVPVYGDNDKYINAKIKIYDDNVNTNFQDAKVPKEKAPHKCLSLIMLDSVLRWKKTYYPQILLEECKYELKKIKMENLIDDDLEKSASGESDSSIYPSTLSIIRYKDIFIIINLFSCDVSNVENTYIFVRLFVYF